MYPVSRNMISKSLFKGLSLNSARSAIQPTNLAMMSIRLNSTLPPSKSATRRRLEEQEQLRNAYKLDILSSGEEEDDLIRKQRKAGTYTPNPEIPNLENLASRWGKLDALDQDLISIYLEDRMRGDWKEMDELEKKAGMCFI